MSATDAWAVGDPDSPQSSSNQALILHWNGRKWSRVASPNPGTQSNDLLGISAVTPTDAWAVGDIETVALRTVVLHWNGRAWRQVASPHPGSSYSVLDGVSAISASHAWAVGYYSSTKGATEKTLILRWNGKVWTRVPSPSPNPDASGIDQLAGVSTVSPGRAFAAGYSDDAFTGVNLMLVVGWNGKRWARP